MLIPLLVLVVLGGAVVLGVGALLGDREGGLLAGVPLLAVAGGGVVLLLLVVLVVGVGRGGRDGDSDEDEPGPAAAPTTSVAVTAPPAAAASEAEADVEVATGVAGPVVDLRAGRRTVVDELPDGAVLHLRLSGFEPDAGGVLRQCRLAGSTFTACTNRLPVAFGFNGGAELHYLLTDRVGGDGCGVTAEPCVVVTSADDVDAVALTVFGTTAPPPGRVTVVPDGGLEAGAVVQVRAMGFPGGTGLSAAQCEPEGRRCRTPVEGRTDAAGDAVLRLRIEAGEPCPGRQPCAVWVTADAPLLPTSAAISFSAGPGADYDAPRLIGFGALALVLLGVATWLVRRTDWHEPAGAATPELDAAVLE